MRRPDHMICWIERPDPTGAPDGFGAQQHMRIERITIPIYDG